MNQSLYSSDQGYMRLSQLDEKVLLMNSLKTIQMAKLMSQGLNPQLAQRMLLKMPTLPLMNTLGAQQWTWMPYPVLDLNQDLAQLAALQTYIQAQTGQQPRESQESTNANLQSPKPSEVQTQEKQKEKPKAEKVKPEPEKPAKQQIEVPKGMKCESPKAKPASPSSAKKIKKSRSTKCPHTQRPYYAKGLCKSCYHKFGRAQKPWACEHDNLYAKGLCQMCYVSQYRAAAKGKAAQNAIDLEHTVSKEKSNSTSNPEETKVELQ